MNMVQEVLQDLISRGKVSRPWLGVSIQDMTPELARYLGTDREEGVLIAEMVLYKTLKFPFRKNKIRIR